MLRTLSVRDFVIVDRIELEFAGGFGALTGETGAGKSILIDALALTLGERSDAGVVRAGCERADITAVFDIAALPAVNDWLVARGLEGEDGLLLRRVIDAGGRSRAWINGAPATVQQVREVGEWLVDIHGQHAHQSLLRADAQRILFDAHAGLAASAAETAAAWQRWRTAVVALDEASDGAATLLRERDRRVWEVEELTALAPQAGEWESLDAEHRRLAHAAGLIEGTRLALDVLAGDGEGCERQVGVVAHRLAGLAEVDPALAEISTLLASVQAELGEAASLLRRYVDRIDLDPNRLAEVERRMESLTACARKYRCPPADLPARLAEAAEQLARLDGAADMAILQAAATAAEVAYRVAAERLSAGRAAAAGPMGEAVSALMRELALSAGRFEIALLPLAQPAASGLEQIEFRVAGLAGGEARPLAKVASGGELSRISLAIQVLTSRSAAVPTLVFDEVDVGIGGGVAEIVGRLLHQLGDERQVLCVTHLPQVAARADWQWQVSKLPAGEATMGAGNGFLSRIVPLDTAGRVEEIARMLGGVDITATTRDHAREMLRSTAKNA